MWLYIHVNTIDVHGTDMHVSFLYWQTGLTKGFATITTIRIYCVYGVEVLSVFFRSVCLKICGDSFYTLV